jgi:hypothetical protein
MDKYKIPRARGAGHVGTYECTGRTLDEEDEIQARIELYRKSIERTGHVRFIPSHIHIVKGVVHDPVGATDVI